MVEKNACPGDNWALRHDCMKFDLPVSFCDLPFMRKLTGFLRPFTLPILTVLMGISLWRGAADTPPSFQGRVGGAGSPLR